MINDKKKLSDWKKHKIYFYFFDEFFYKLMFFPFKIMLKIIIISIIYWVNIITKI